MDMYIWLLVVIFIFHDMEEITGMKRWLNKNYDRIINRVPLSEKILSKYKNVSTAAFATAVYEELILLILICLLAQISHLPVIYGIWFGGLIGFTIHLFVHLMQAAIIRSYVPALITSILCIPVSILLIKTCYPLIDMHTSVVTGIFIGIVGVAVNLKLAHMLMLRIEKMHISSC